MTDRQEKDKELKDIGSDKKEVQRKRKEVKRIMKTRETEKER